MRSPPANSTGRTTVRPGPAADDGRGMADLLHEARRTMGDIDSRPRASRPDRTGGQARTGRAAPALRVPATTAPRAPATTGLRARATTARLSTTTPRSAALSE